MNFSIQFYGQAFIFRGRYSDFNFVDNAIASSFNDRVSLYNQDQISFEIDGNSNEAFLMDKDLNNTVDYCFEKPDFSFMPLQTNLVERWEYIPGSELFFVWARSFNGLKNSNNSLTDSVGT